MSVLISLHCASLGAFLESLKADRNINICDSHADSRILHRVNLKGNEKRAFTNEEIKKILKDYLYFKEWFTKKNLWLWQESSTLT